MKRMVNVLFAGVLAMTVLSCGEEKKGYTPVSYTHLDVYKRQELCACAY